MAAKLQGSWHSQVAEVEGRVFCWEHSSNDRPGSYMFSLPKSDLETSCSASSPGTSSPLPLLKQSAPCPPGDASFGWVRAARRHPALARGRTAFLRLGCGGGSPSHRGAMSGLSHQNQASLTRSALTGGGCGWPPGKGRGTRSLVLPRWRFEGGSQWLGIILV